MQCAKVTEVKGFGHRMMGRGSSNEQKQDGWFQVPTSSCIKAQKQISISFNIGCTNLIEHSIVFYPCLPISLLELYIKLVFSGWYQSVFLGIYHTDIKGNLGWYISVSYRMFKKYVFTVSN
jgi:hypothetical protein